MLFPALLTAALLAVSNAAPQSIQGDYVEARAASVFAGACHYNGELVTSGQEAVLAFHITAGSWKSIPLANLNAVASISADLNLADPHAAKKTELVIDSSASDAQAAAFTQALQSRFPDALGKIISIKRAPITFTHNPAGNYTVNAPRFAALNIDPMPDAACCKQPNLVWYSPLIPLLNRKVGFTNNAAYSAGTSGSAWQRHEENSAFYGMFSF